MNIYPLLKIGLKQHEIRKIFILKKTTCEHFKICYMEGCIV